MSPDDVVNVLRQLALEAQGPASYVWGILVRQQIIQGVYVTLLSACVMVLGGTMFWKNYARAVRYIAENDENHSMSFLVCVLGGTICLASLLVLSDSPLRLINPEYYALRDLLSRMGK